MGKKLSWLTLAAILPLALVLGCGEQGKVDQGRVIAFDKNKETVTFIIDVKHDTANPDYSGAPVTFALPKDPMERGEDPKAGHADEAGHQDQGNRHLRSGHEEHEEDNLHAHRPERKRGQGQSPGGR